MTRLNNPDTLFFSSLPPFQVTGGPHEFLNILENALSAAHKPHSVQNSVINLIDNIVLNLIMAIMPSPYKHIGRCQYFLAKPKFRLIQSGCSHLKTGFAGKKSDIAPCILEDMLQPPFISFFMEIFIPYRYFNIFPSVCTSRYIIFSAATMG